MRFLPPATKLGQGNIFTGVCDSVHRGWSASVDAGIPPPPGPGTTTSPQGPGTPRSRHPPPPNRAYWEIWPTSGRYASYLNAILLYVKLKTQLGYCRLNTATLIILRMFITTVWATIWNEWTWKTNVTHKLQIIVKLPYRALHIEAWKKDSECSRIPSLIYCAAQSVYCNST